MTPVFAAFKRQAEKHGFQLAIVMFPVRRQVDAEFVNDYPQQKMNCTLW